MDTRFLIFMKPRLRVAALGQPRATPWAGLARTVGAVEGTAKSRTQSHRHLIRIRLEDRRELQNLAFHLPNPLRLQITIRLGCIGSNDFNWTLKTQFVAVWIQ